MKNILLMTVVLGLSTPNANAQFVDSTIPSLPGWRSIPGDEFNGSSIDKNNWGLYGDPAKYYSNEFYGNNEKQGMAQIYRDKMVMVKDGVATIRATRDAIETGLNTNYAQKKNLNPGVMSRTPLHPEHNFSDIGWWSGFMSSRDAKKYYPFYSRIEVKAKVPYEFGTWMALWLRHRMGASKFEIDLLEFFVNDDDKDWTDWQKHTYKYAGKKVLHQSIHGLRRTLGENNKIVVDNSYNYNPYEERVREVSFDPSADFHVYGAQIDPLPGDSAVHFAVSFLLDGRVRSVFSTKDYKIKNTSIYKYNEVLKNEYFVNGDLEHVWDVAINGGIGGKPDGKGGGVLYPHQNPKYGGDINKTPHNYDMNVDWLRVYKRTNKPLWLGSVPVSWDWRSTTAEVAVPAVRFADLQVGDQLVIDIDTLSASEFRQSGKIKLDIYDKQGKSLTTLKPGLSQQDAQVTFIVDTEDFCNKLKREGCVLKGENVRLFSVCRSSKNSAKWVGFKQMKWGETIVPAEQFKDLRYGQKIEIMVRDVEPNAKVYLQQYRKPEPGNRSRPSLSSDKQYGHILKLTEGSDEKVYTFVPNEQAVKELKIYGLGVTGKGFFLRSVRVVDGQMLTSSVSKMEIAPKNPGAVYTISGIKVADSYKEGTLPKGVYIVDGKKIVVK